MDEERKAPEFRPAGRIGGRGSAPHQFEQALRGIAVDDLLPHDQGLRVFGNWKIIEVQKCEAYETEIGDETETPT